ncbi:hypothetical protein HRbin16_03059 [bacterium HR16]|nr:hypothetical protein HRbin16_03059 [bacterium HR16]
MFVDTEQYEAQRRQLNDALRTLRNAPNRIVDVLQTAQRDFGALYRAKSELRDEAWKQRLTKLVQSAEGNLSELQAQVETAYTDAEKLANQLANEFPLPADTAKQSAFLARYAIASNRLTALLGYADDSGTASTLRVFMENGTFERDTMLALACWLDAGQVADARGWSVTNAVLLELEPLLPEPTRSMIALGRELATGMHRVRTGFAQAFSYVRNTARTVAVIPAWKPEDGVIRVDATSVQQTQSAVL